MCDHLEKKVFKSQLVKRHSDQRSLCKIEWNQRVLPHPPKGFSLTPRRRECSQIEHLQRNRQHGGNDLNRLAIFDLERRPKRLMAADNFIESLVERRQVEFEAEAFSEAFAIKRIVRLELVQHPESLLPVRQRSPVRTRARRNRCVPCGALFILAQQPLDQLPFFGRQIGETLGQRGSVLWQLGVHTIPIMLESG